MASESVQPIELDAQTVFSKLNGRLGYIQESVDKLNECRQNLAQQELASEIRDDLGAFERESHVSDQSKELFLFAQDFPDHKTHEILTRQAHTFLGELPKLRKHYRAAFLNSKKEIDSIATTRRDPSSHSLVDNVKPEKEEVAHEKAWQGGNEVMTTNQNLTDTLRRTALSMQAELEKSVLATQILETSTATIRSSTIQQEVLDTVIDTSKQLVKALEKADWMDRLVLLAAVLFFTIVVLFILKQRIFDRGMRVMFWWTRYIGESKEEL